ncbi:MAG: alpha/beta hydrolase fold protein [Marmoricola sp.]|nr:alpha/beta hydrolase fold protein [Marmoricola sp.]
MADRSGRASVGDVELDWEAYGDPTDPPLLLVMGLATQMLGWDDRFCTRLADLGLHVVRFDNRDIGGSTHLTDRGVPDLAAMLAGGPDAPAPAYTLVEMALDTVGLLDALGLDSAHVVGASMGGMIAQQVAISHPTRVRSLTSIMSTPSRQVGRPRPEAQAALLVPPATDEESAVQRSLQVYGVIGSPGFPMDVARRTEIARRSFEREGDPTGSARQYAAILGSPDRTPGCAGWTCPRWCCTARTTRWSSSRAGRPPRTRSRAPGWSSSPGWATTSPSRSGRGSSRRSPRSCAPPSSSGAERPPGARGP